MKIQQTEPMHEVAQASSVDPLYTSGDYFGDPGRFGGDAAFKSEAFLRLFLDSDIARRIEVSSYIDVGCGSGAIVERVSAGLRQAGCPVSSVKGYDVSPHVSAMKDRDCEFVQGDFCESDEDVDLVTLFDVFEHVPAPVDFLKRIAEKCSIVGMHIPLDNNLNAAMRDMFRAKLSNPGHLIFLDVASALNLLTFSGLRVIDYRYTFAFQAPSGHKTLMSKAVYPFRAMLAKFSPWLCGKTIGGTSLVVLALTPRGLQKSK